MKMNRSDIAYNDILKELQRCKNILKTKDTIIDVLQDHIKSDAKIISALYTELKKYKPS
ncbi:MAG: hypothetical protein J6J23_04505 [Clostridia bacterium]|nr:hypothetical protein [Clostridia bacterium]